MDNIKFDDLFKKEDSAELTEVGKDFTEEERAFVVKQRNRELLINNVITLWRQGKTKHEIEQLLNLTYSQVTYAIKTVEERLKSETDAEYLSKRREAVEQLELCKRELWDSWYKSKKVDRKVTIKRATVNNRQNTPTQGQPTVQEMEEQVEEMHGNIDYMKGIMWCIQEQSKLQGLHAPKKVANTDVEGNNLPVKSAREEILQMLGDMKYNINTYEERKALESANVLEAEIIREVDDISPKKPTRLLSAIAENSSESENE